MPDCPICHLLHEENRCPLAPVCPRCGNNRQVWANQITGLLTCHRAGCHTVISTGDSLGVSPATVAALVGHAAKTQTGRYTHKFSPELSEAEQVIGGHLAGVMGL